MSSIDRSLELEERPLTPVTPIYYFGDSNTQLFRNRTIDYNEYFPRPLALIEFCIPGIAASDLVDDGVLHPELWYLTRRARTTHRKDIPKQGRADFLLGIDVLTPPPDVVNLVPPAALVLLLGTMDLSKIMARIGPQYDFALDDPYFCAESFRDAAKLRPNPREPVVTLIRDALKPLGEAIAIMQSSNVKNIVIHSLHPPTLDDDRYFRIRHIPCLASVRYKVAILINRELARIAGRQSCTFLDLWPDMTINGVLDERFILDGDHINDVAAALYVRRLLEHLLSKRGTLQRLTRIV